MVTVSDLHIRLDRDQCVISAGVRKLQATYKLLLANSSSTDVAFLVCY